MATIVGSQKINGSIHSLRSHSPCVYLLHILSSALAHIEGSGRMAKTFILLLTIFLPIFPATIQLKVSTTENVGLLEAGIGQPFLLHVIVENASNTAQYPIIKNVEKYNVRRSGFQMNMVNSHTCTTYSYQIRIDELGSYTLGPAQITETTGIIESEPLQITVAQEQKTVEAKRNSDSKSKSSFLRLTCNKNIVTVGERAQCTLTFYTADQLVSLQTLIEPDQSSINGFIIKNKTGPITGNQTINGTQHRYAQWSWDIIPTKPGTIVIPAYAADYNTQTNNNMFALFFKNNDLKRTYSNTISLTANPLPSNTSKPMLIGSVTQFSAKIEPGRARVGEGMVLTLSLTSDGDLDAMQMIPLVGMPEQLKWYESKAYDEPSKADPTFTSHSMEYIVQALQPGDYQIPAQEITYFDTRDRAYKTCKTNQLSVTITGTAPNSKKTGENQNMKIETALAIETTDEIKPIAQYGPWTAQPLRLVPWQLYWLLTAIMTIAWLLFILITTNQSWLYKRVARWNSNISLYSRARKQIKDAHTAGNYSAFYTIFINLLAAHYGLETAQVSPEIIEEKLRASGLSAQALQDWKLFYTRIAESGFYKQSSDPYWHSHLYEQALYWIDIIEKLPRRNLQ